MSLFFFSTSFIGWFFETIVCLIADHRLSDRGFLTLPLCPVYGLPISIAYFCIGTPKEGVIVKLFAKIPAKTDKGKRWRFLGVIIAYFLMAAAIATLFELFAAILLKTLNASMWDYGALPWNYKGFVCFSISFIWGVLLTISALTFLNPLFLGLSRLNKRVKRILSVCLWVLLASDVIFNLFYLKTNGRHYEWIFDNLHIL